MVDTSGETQRTSSGVDPCRGPDRPEQCVFGGPLPGCQVTSSSTPRRDKTWTSDMDVPVVGADADAKANKRDNDHMVSARGPSKPAVLVLGPRRVVGASGVVDTSGETQGTSSGVDPCRCPDRPEQCVIGGALPGCAAGGGICGCGSVFSGAAGMKLQERSGGSAAAEAQRRKRSGGSAAATPAALPAGNQQ